MYWFVASDAHVLAAAAGVMLRVHIVFFMCVLSFSSHLHTYRAFCEEIEKVFTQKNLEKSLHISDVEQDADKSVLIYSNRYEEYMRTYLNSLALSLHSSPRRVHAKSSLSDRRVRISSLSSSSWQVALHVRICSYVCMCVINDDPHAALLSVRPSSRRK